jgi:alanine racemase
MTRPIRAELSSSALRHNYALAKARAPGAKVFAVVKANAYGHGIVFAQRALGEVDGYATLELECAHKLRALGVSAPILMLEGFFHEDEVAQFARNRLTSVIHSSAQVAMLMEAAIDRPLDVYLKFNTGMNRLGLTDGGVRYALGMAAQGKNFGAVTLMTHFAQAETAEGVAAPLRAFGEIEVIARAAITAKPFAASLANSAAILHHPETHRDWVRAGIMLYGSSPFEDEGAAMLGLRPVMTLLSEIISVQTLKRGDTVGYGDVFHAPRKMRIGIVACGYADGYPRHAPGGNDAGAPVLVAGRRTRTVGRVSMDMLAVDITDMPFANPGTPVTLWGQGLPVDEVARAAGTVSYELLCALAPRVPVKEVE